MIFEIAHVTRSSLVLSLDKSKFKESQPIFFKGSEGYRGRIETGDEKWRNIILGIMRTSIIIVVDLWLREAISNASQYESPTLLSMVFL